MNKIELFAMSAAMTLLGAPASATEYTFNVLTTQGTLIEGMNEAGDMVVDTANADGTSSCALVQGGNTTPIVNPEAPSYTWCTGVSLSDEIVGYTLDLQNFTTVGFIWGNGAFTETTKPVAGATPYGISENGQFITGTYQNKAGNFTGFTLHGTKARSFQAQGAVQTFPIGIKNAGHVSGYANDANFNTFSWLKEGKSYVAVAVPNAALTIAYGVSDKNIVAGYYLDAQYNVHGFVFKSHSGGYATVDVPNATETIWYGVTDNGTLYGQVVLPSSPGKGARSQLARQLALPGVHVPGGGGGNVFGVYAVPVRK